MNQLIVKLMKGLYIFSIITSLFLSANNLNAQKIWTGPKITFAKADSADWTLQTNQDRISNNVWITRANTKGIFNIAREITYTAVSSPSDTEWAFGTTAGFDTLKFNNWETTNAGNPPGMVNRDMVLHLITDSIYIDIKFTNWAAGGIGGGFNYERSTDQSLSTIKFETNSKIKLFPNPASVVINISGLTDNEGYIIYNLSGTEIFNGTFNTNGKIDIKNYSNGLYLLKSQNGNTYKFVKE